MIDIMSQKIKNNQIKYTEIVFYDENKQQIKILKN